MLYHSATYKSFKGVGFSRLFLWFGRLLLTCLPLNEEALRRRSSWYKIARQFADDYCYKEFSSMGGSDVVETRGTDESSCSDPQLVRQRRRQRVPLYFIECRKVEHSLTINRSACRISGLATTKTYHEESIP